MSGRRGTPFSFIRGRVSQERVFLKTQHKLDKERAMPDIHGFPFSFALQKLWKLERALGRVHTFAYHKIGYCLLSSGNIWGDEAETRFVDFKTAWVRRHVSGLLWAESLEVISNTEWVVDTTQTCFLHVALVLGLTAWPRCHGWLLHPASCIRVCEYCSERGEPYSLLLNWGEIYRCTSTKCSEIISCMCILRSFHSSERRHAIKILNFKSDQFIKELSFLFSASCTHCFPTIAVCSSSKSTG